MLEVVNQRKYIQDFLDFVGSFLIDESVTIDELSLVKENLEILRERISKAGSCLVDLSLPPSAPPEEDPFN